ncbi:hypothetical protein BGK70_00295 [Streptomyces agglomeratus]|nr:hypothetical protein BGK70_00295 [Streptomyces agglomeratus]
MPGWAAQAVRLPRRNRPAKDAVRAHPGQHLDRQAPEQEREAGCVVSGVRDDEDVRVTRLPLPCCDQPLKQITQLAGGDGCGVVPGCQAECVQRCGP